MTEYTPDMLDMEAVDMTKNFEGFRPDIYKDTKGKRTIGHGFNIDDPTVAKLLPKSVLMGQRTLTPDESSQIFTKLYIRSIKDAQNLVGENWGRIPPQIKNVVIDMTYNMGKTKMSGFKEMIKALKKLDFDKAGIEMKDSNWYGQVGDRSGKLYNMMMQPNNKVLGY